MAGHNDRTSGGLGTESTLARQRARVVACLTLCVTLVGVVTLHRWQGNAAFWGGSPIAREWILSVSL